MNLALAQVSTLRSTLEKDVEDYAAGNCHAIELWLGKVETYLQSHSVDDLRKLLDEYDMVAPVASFQGGLFVPEGEKREQHWHDFGRRLQLCQQLGVETLVVALDLVGGLTQEDLERVRVSLTKAAAQAGKQGLRLALEFQAGSTFGNNLETALALIDETGSPHLGVCLDVFHYYTGPSKPEDLSHLTLQNLFHVQLSDLAGVARELATDADRILPGEGDFLLTPLVEHLRALGYTGYLSIELMNPQIWQVPAREFGEVAMSALELLVGKGSTFRGT